MLNLLRRYRLASELKVAEHQRGQSKSARERRALISIGVIDDGPFEPKKNLENVGYQVALLGDPSTIEVATTHHIILCDLQGVGSSLDSRKQGAFLIREIKRNYPEKYVIAYTGGTMNLAISRDALQVSDYFLKKDVDIETWVERLDSIISKLLDPYAVWQRQRKALVDREVDSVTILKLEDAFVRSIENRSGPDQSALAKLLSSSEISSDVRAIIRSLITSGLFKLLAS